MLTNSIVSKKPFMDLEDDDELTQSLLDTINNETEFSIYQRFGFPVNPFLRPKQWLTSSTADTINIGKMWVKDALSEREIFIAFLKACKESKFMLLRGPTGIGKTSLIDYIHSMLVREKVKPKVIEAFSSPNYTIKDYDVMKLDLESTYWDIPVDTRKEQIENLLKAEKVNRIKHNKALDITIVLLDNIVGISDCWDTITRVFESYLGQIHIIGTAKISEWMFLDSYWQKNVDERTKHVKLFIQSFEVIYDLHSWTERDIVNLLNNRLDLAIDKSEPIFDEVAKNFIVQLAFGIPQLALRMIDEVLVSGWKDQRLEKYDINAVKNLMSPDKVEELLITSQIGRAAGFDSEPPEDLKRTYQGLVRGSTRRKIITTLTSAYGGIKVQTGHYLNTVSNELILQLAKDAIQNLPMSQNRLCKEIEGSSTKKDLKTAKKSSKDEEDEELDTIKPSTMSYHLNWLEENKLIVRKTQEDKENLILPKNENGIDLFETLSTKFIRPRTL